MQRALIGQDRLDLLQPIADQLEVGARLAVHRPNTIANATPAAHSIDRVTARSLGLALER